MPSRPFCIHHCTSLPYRCHALCLAGRLDEATALAAGHRPCALCRHADYQRFTQAWTSSRPVDVPRADDIDRALHAERLQRGGAKRTYMARPSDLPDGTMVALDGRAWLILGRELVAWSAAGYTDRRRRPTRTKVAVLTPPSTVAAIRGGYHPALHPSAEDR